MKNSSKCIKSRGMGGVLSIVVIQMKYLPAYMYSLLENLAWPQWTGLKICLASLWPQIWSIYKLLAHFQGVDIKYFKLEFSLNFL